MTERAWWIGVVVLAGALLLHAAVPRYQVQAVSVSARSAAVVRLDRWSGRVEVVPALLVTSPRMPVRSWLQVVPILPADRPASLRGGTGVPAGQ